MINRLEENKDEKLNDINISNKNLEELNDKILQEKFTSDELINRLEENKYEKINDTLNKLIDNKLEDKEIVIIDTSDKKCRKKKKKT